MSFEKTLETFYFEGKKQFSIVVFDMNKEEIYSETLKFSENEEALFDKKNNFIEKNILKIEKKFQNFVKHINLIMDEKFFSEINISVKNIKFDEKISKDNIEYMINDLKRYVQDNNRNDFLTSIRINNFIIKNKIYNNLETVPNISDYAINVKFILLSNQIRDKLKSKFLELEVEIDKFYSTDALSVSSVESAYDVCVAAANHFFLDDNLEVSLIKKIPKKMAFFERFFHFLSKG